MGILNAKAIPRPKHEKDQQDTLQSVAKYLNITCIVRNGIYRNGNTKKKNSFSMNDLKNDIIPVFDTEGRLEASIRKDRFFSLFNAYMSFHKITKPTCVEMLKLNEELHKIMQGLRLHTGTGKWKVKTCVNKVIIDEFLVTTECLTDPLSRELTVPKFLSTNKNDSIFGAKLFDHETIQEENCIINAIFRPQDIKRVLIIPTKLQI